MAYSNDPVFAQTVATAQKTLVAQKSTLSGVTNATEIYAAPATEGARITRLWALPLATLATALRVDLYISPDGVAALLVGSITIPAQTIAATGAITETQDTRWSPEEPLELGAGERLYAGLSTAFASGVNVCAQLQKLTAAV